jgi:nucleotide-binding universal stress UspA family protein
MTRILLALDDSSAGLSAARTAIGLAYAMKAELRAVTVMTDLPPAPGRQAPTREGAERAAQALLDFVVDLGTKSGVSTETATLHGQPARAILDQAADYAADLIVIGKSGNRHVGQPYVGSDVKHVLEFSEVPVVVVPSP